MPSQCLICKTLDFKRFWLNPKLHWLLTLHITSMKLTVFLNGKYSNTTYISKI